MVSSYSRAGTARNKTHQSKTKTKNTSNAKKKPPTTTLPSRPPGNLPSLASSRKGTTRKQLEKKNTRQQQQQQPRRSLFPSALPSRRGGRKSLQQASYSSQPSSSASSQQEHVGGFDVEMSQLTEYSHESSNHSTSNSLIPELHQSSAASSSRSSCNNSLHSGRSLYEMAIGGGGSGQSRGGTVPAAPPRRSWMPMRSGSAGSVALSATLKSHSGGTVVLEAPSVKRSILSNKETMTLDRTVSVSNNNMLDVPQDAKTTTTTTTLEQHAGNQESKITDHFKPKRSG